MLLTRLVIDNACQVCSVRLQEEPMGKKAKKAAKEEKDAEALKESKSETVVALDSMQADSSRIDAISAGDKERIDIKDTVRNISHQKGCLKYTSF